MNLTKLALAAFLTLNTYSFAGSKSECACDAKCQENCAQGKGESCECKSCNCSKTGKCEHKKCEHHEKTEANKEAHKK